jgi:hypothetical protein
MLPAVMLVVALAIRMKVGQSLYSELRRPNRMGYGLRYDHSEERCDHYRAFAHASQHRNRLHPTRQQVTPTQGPGKLDLSHVHHLPRGAGEIAAFTNAGKPVWILFSYILRGYIWTLVANRMVLALMCLRWCNDERLTKDDGK